MSNPWIYLCSSYTRAARFTPGQIAKIQKQLIIIRHVEPSLLYKKGVYITYILLHDVAFTSDIKLMKEEKTHLKDKHKFYKTWAPA